MLLVHWIIHYLSFGDCFISFHIMFSRLIHIVACVRISFLFKAEYCSIEYINHICLPIHLLMDAWVSSTFWLLLMDIQILLQHPALNFGGYVSRCGIAGLYGNSIFVASFINFIFQCPRLIISYFFFLQNGFYYPEYFIKWTYLFNWLLPIFHY